jgi:RNA polymerase sigma-70 factor (ECF subfamily)
MAIMDLIERTIAGDQRAFERLFDEHKNLVYKTAYLILDDPSEAEDALQEIFLRAYRYLGRYDPSKGAFTTWIYRISVNHCLSQRRRLARFLPWRERIDASVDATIEDDFAESQRLQNALTELSPKLRAILVLRFFLDLSYAEMAQVLEIPLGTVKSRLHLALSKARQELKGEISRARPIREVSE